MDVVTHVLVGACVAQIPRQSDGNNTKLDLNFHQRAMIGGIAAIFPDIDYLLFFWNPLEFLAYWHRAETHSLLLAPLWAWLLTKVWMRSRRLKPFRHLIFWVSLFGLLSHSMIDSLTTYGTQWFAPLSDYRISWNLLFVLDGYFTICVAITLWCLYFKHKTKFAFLIFVLPLSYLLFVAQIKLAAYQQISLQLVEQPSTLSILPQPFSPFYWQIIKQNKNNIGQAYIHVTDDPIALLISKLLGKQGYQDSFQSIEQLHWKDYSLTPQNAHLQAEASMVWHHQSFKAFRDFAVYPIYYQHTKTGSAPCVWFSDLRYHWPGFLPSFRYGMCSEKGNTWTVHRMKYLTREPTQL